MTTQNHHRDLVATFLKAACWDHHVHGKGDHRMYDFAAQRRLQQHPEIGRLQVAQLLETVSA